MCLPEPGPRCSFHAHRAYVRAQARFAEASTVDEKQSAGRELRERREVYESTPRGIDDLRLLVGRLEDGLEKDAARVSLENGERRRSESLKAWREMVDNQDVEVKRVVSASGVSRGRGKYVTATAVALKLLREKYPAGNWSVAADDRISGDAGLVMVLPSKWRGEVDRVSYVSDDWAIGDKVLSGLVASRSLDELAHPPVGLAKEINAWWFSKLESSGFIGVALVDVKTATAHISSLEEAQKLVSSAVRLERNASGTKPWKSGRKALAPLLAGTVFEKGVLVETSGGGVVITGIPPQPVQNLKTDELLFSFEQGENESWFSVKKRNLGNKYKVVVVAEHSAQVSREWVTSAFSSRLV